MITLVVYRYRNVVLGKANKKSGPVSGTASVSLNYSIYQFLTILSTTASFSVERRT